MTRSILIELQIQLRPILWSANPAPRNVSGTGRTKWKWRRREFTNAVFVIPLICVKQKLAVEISLCIQYQPRQSNCLLLPWRQDNSIDGMWLDLTISVWIDGMYIPPGLGLG